MRLNVLYSADDNYTDILGISIISLLENNKHFNEIFIYVIYCGIKKESIEKLRHIVIDTYHRNMVFYKLSLITDNYEINAPKKSYYGRFFAPIICEENTILYLDCDVIINNDLCPLWETDIRDYKIGAVQGPGISKENRDKLNISKEYRYINSGVLLINLEEWRKTGLTDQLLHYLAEKGEIPPYHDQNIINALCYDSTLILEPHFNLLWSMMCCRPKDICKLNCISEYYTEEEIKYAIENPTIIHFSNSIYGRPWKKGCTHKYKDIFIKYKNISPWANNALKDNKISILKKIRYFIYRKAPSKIYIILQRIERFYIKKIVPLLPNTKSTRFIQNYMNGN